MKSQTARAWAPRWRSSTPIRVRAAAQGAFNACVPAVAADLLAGSCTCTVQLSAAARDLALATPCPCRSPALPASSHLALPCLPCPPFPAPADVAEAQPDYILRTQIAPNDPLHPPSTSTPFSGLWFLSRIGAETAWDTTTGSQQVRGGGAEVQLAAAASAFRPVPSRSVGVRAPGAWHPRLPPCSSPVCSPDWRVCDRHRRAPHARGPGARDQGRLEPVSAQGCQGWLAGEQSGTHVPRQHAPACLPPSPPCTNRPCTNRPLCAARTCAGQMAPATSQ